jgi:hypothetical protein
VLPKATLRTVGDAVREVLGLTAIPSPHS